MHQDRRLYALRLKREGKLHQLRAVLAAALRVWERHKKQHHQLSLRLGQHNTPKQGIFNIGHEARHQALLSQVRNAFVQNAKALGQSAQRVHTAQTEVAAAFRQLKAVEVLEARVRETARADALRREALETEERNTRARRP